MTHVIIKLHPGRTEEQKKRLAEEITKDQGNRPMPGENSFRGY